MLRRSLCEKQPEKLTRGALDAMKPLDRHKKLTEVRVKAFNNLFRCTPIRVHCYYEFVPAESSCLVDVFTYSISPTNDDVRIEVGVTNGLSDYHLTDRQEPSYGGRREIVQYFHKCTPAHAKRLHDMASLPITDGFFLDFRHTVAWDKPAVPGTPWNNALFLAPLMRKHADFKLDIAGDTVELLWHVPISDQELDYKRTNGVDGLLDRMEEVELPWVFTESNRPALV